jgi:hypothetical protein
MIDTDLFCSERLRPTHARKIKKNFAEVLAGGHPEFFAFFLLKNASHGVRRPFPSPLMHLLSNAWHGA